VNNLAERRIFHFSSADGNLVFRLVHSADVRVKPVHTALTTHPLRTHDSSTAPTRLGGGAEKTQNIIEICRNINGICKNLSGIFENISDILSFWCAQTEFDVGSG